MVVISSMYFVMFLLCSLLLASQRPARGDDQHTTIESGSLDRPTLAPLYTFEHLSRRSSRPDWQQYGYLSVKMRQFGKGSYLNTLIMKKYTIFL